MATMQDSPAVEHGQKRLKVAVIGGGPGGLAAGIALSALPNVDVTVFEQARELKGIGVGVTLGYNAWRVLEVLGAADAINGHRRLTIDHRNGLTEELVGATAVSLPPRYHPRRNLEEGGVRLSFADGTTTTADLVVGADGIRSVDRDFIFPDHKTSFTGTTVWRTLIPWRSMSKFPDLEYKTTWYHSPVGFVMTTPVDDPEEIDKDTDGLFEVSIRRWVDPKSLTEEKFRWGIDATNEKVLSNFTEYGPRVQEVLKHVPDGVWREYSAFAGPHLEKLVGWNKVVLLGDASHPLSGAFGSGAAFAMEDGWILARSIEHGQGDATSVSEAATKALEIFDSIRSPYYAKMYEYIDSQAKKVEGAKANAKTARISEWDAQLRTTVNSMIGEGLTWIYLSDIEEVWKTYLKEAAAPVF